MRPRSPTDLLRRGLVPRTFPASHPLADHLRLTVRSTDEDDRLIAAAREIEAELAGRARRDDAGRARPDDGHAAGSGRRVSLDADDPRDRRSS